VSERVDGREGDCARRTLVAVMPTMALTQKMTQTVMMLLSRRRESARREEREARKGEREREDAQVPPAVHVADDGEDRAGDDARHGCSL